MEFWQTESCVQGGITMNNRSYMKIKAYMKYRLHGFVYTPSFLKTHDNWMWIKYEKWWQINEYAKIPQKLQN